MAQTEIVFPSSHRRGCTGSSNWQNSFDFAWREQPTAACLLCRIGGHGGANSVGEIFLADRIIAGWNNNILPLPNQLDMKTGACPPNVPVLRFLIPQDLLRPGNFQIHFRYRSGAHAVVIFEVSLETQWKPEPFFRHDLIQDTQARSIVFNIRGLFRDSALMPSIDQVAALKAILYRLRRKVESKVIFGSFPACKIEPGDNILALKSEIDRICLFGAASASVSDRDKAVLQAAYLLACYSCNMEMEAERRGAFLEAHASVPVALLVLKWVPEFRAVTLAFQHLVQICIDVILTQQDLAGMLQSIQINSEF